MNPRRATLYLDSFTLDVIGSCPERKLSFRVRSILDRYDQIRKAGWMELASFLSTQEISLLKSAVENCKPEPLDYLSRGDFTSLLLSIPDSRYDSLQVSQKDLASKVDGLPFYLVVSLIELLEEQRRVIRFKNRGKKPSNPLD